jgi:hypothetical protein
LHIAPFVFTVKLQAHPAGGTTGNKKDNFCPENQKPQPIVFFEFIFANSSVLILFCKRYFPAISEQRPG